MLVVAVTVGGMIAGCSGDSDADPSTAPSSEPSDSASAAGYTSTSFVVPFSAASPEWIADQPSEETETFVTWDDGDVAIRVLAPVSLYPSAGTTEEPLPDDYQGYLLDEEDVGAMFEDVLRTHVDENPALLLTGTTASSLDGDIGCPEEGLDPTVCFGFQPDLRLRLAAIDVGGEHVVVWLRTFVDDDSLDLEDLDARFEGFLESMRFTG